MSTPSREFEWIRVPTTFQRDYDSAVGIRRFFQRPLPFGTRVLVSPDPVYGGPFLNAFSGTVESSKPAPGLTPRAAAESKFVYWIAFDSPQLDLDGDGPYVESEVLATHVTRLALKRHN